MPRCAWTTTEPAITYHDEEWGVPVHDDRVLFEFLILEGAQAGLSWNTILKKRENYRKAFDGFRPEKIARYGKRDVQRLLRNDGIVRNRLKIAAASRTRKTFSASKRNSEVSTHISGPSLAASRSRIIGERWLTYPRAPPNLTP
jgi:DNA-3-methyladenine glycosylase I